MCRLFGYVCDSPRSIDELLGHEGLAAFTSLTAVHADGWGMAWHGDGGRLRSETAVATAATDPRFADLARTPLSASGLAHLRWATGGLEVRPENTHPFIADEIAFAHNGHIAPIERLEGLLTPQSRAALQGQTDSERYFRFVHQTIERCGDEVTGVQQALATLITTFPDCSLNALMLTPDRLFAVHVNSRATSPLRALRDLFDDEEDIPPRHATEYFAMDYRVGPDRIEIVSSGLGQPGWSSVPDDSAVMIDLSTRETTRLDPVAADVDPS